MIFENFHKEVLTIRKETEERIAQARKALLENLPFKEGNKIRDKQTGEIYVFSRVSYNSLFSTWGTLYVSKLKKDGTISKVEKWICNVTSMKDLSRFEKISE